MAAEPVWRGPVLLVPITVEALVLTHALLGERWSWERPHFQSLRDFGSVGGEPFRTQNPTLPGYSAGAFTGVVLHWALPDGITRGAQQPSGEVRYPAVPNRWLVLRKHRDPADPANWAYRAWIVASDYVGGDGSSFPNAAGDGGISIGRSWPLDEWPGESEVRRAALPPRLTATGPGDAAFAAFTPNVENVLSFADPLADLPPGPVTYLVQGWYGLPEHDPLLGALRYGPSGWQTEDEWRDLMAALGWSVGDEADLQNAVAAGVQWAVDHGFDVDPTRPRMLYPSHTLCHGMVAEVSWLGPDGRRVSGVPTANHSSPAYVKPQVAVGNSTVDAVAALVADALARDGLPPPEVSWVVDVLEALQYDCLPVLDREDAQAQLDLQIQSGWFSGAAGGSRWSAVAPPDADSPQGRPTPPPLTPEQARALTDLNRDQRLLDQTVLRLNALQWDLYALWWKRHRLDAIIPRPKKYEEWRARILEATARVEPLVMAEVDRYAVLRQRRDRGYQRLGASLRDATLVSGTGPPFWQANEPAVVVSGARRSYKHGADGRFAEDDTLFCRFTGQTISGIEVQVKFAEVIVDAAEVPLPDLSSPELPLEAGDVAAEAFFLDLASAPFVAWRADPADPWPHLGDIRKEQTLIWNPDLHAGLDRRTIAEESGLQTMYGLGALPSKVSVEIWSPPWSPLYLDWEIDFRPAADTPRDALAQWELPSGTGPDPRDDFTYRWAGPQPPPPGPAARLRGRTLLTPQPADLLPARIEQTIERYGSDPSTARPLWALEAALRYFENADLLSQDLDGFNMALLERDPRMSRRGASGLDPWLRPLLAPALVPDATPEPAGPPLQFNPIRGGHAEVQRLWVVDGFGQVFDVLGAMGVEPADFEPVLGTDLSTAGSRTLIELKPRITQPARLEVELLSAASDTEVVGVDPGANPVCGWIVPNRVDRSLHFYEADGTPRGELLVAAGAAQWLPPPNLSPPPNGSPRPVKIDDRHLRTMVLGILEAPDTGAALEALLDLFDEAAWATAPGPLADGDLPAWIGQPTAVVRARASLRLLGLPAVRQRWDDTGRDDTGGFDAVRFPVQLGSTELLDDGLVGYYLDDDYTHIDSPYAPPGNAYVRRARPELATAGPPALLTVLMAPHSKLYAVAGILPPQAVALPGPFLAPELERMQVTFRTGPVVGSAAAPSLPLPAVDQGTWSWLQYDGTQHPARESAVLPADPNVPLPSAAPLLREGWLKLVLGSAATRFTYTVGPAAVAVATAERASTVSLSVTVWNGTGEDVACARIETGVPVGEGVAELTAEPALIEPSLPEDADWVLTSDGRGNITLSPRPPLSGLMRGQALVLMLAGVNVNRWPGAATLRVREETGALRTGAVTVVKVRS